MAEGSWRRAIPFLALIAVGGIVIAVSLYGKGAKSSIEDVRDRLPEVPADVLTVNDKCDGEARPECDRLPITEGPARRRRIYFREIEAIDSLWSGDSASFTLAGRRLPASTRAEDWGNEITTGDVSEDDVAPYLDTTLPAIGRGQRHTTIRASTQLGVRYPVAADGGFRNSGFFDQRRVSFFVVAPEEMDVLEELTDPRLSDGVVGTLQAIAVILIVVGVFGTIRRVWPNA